MMIAARLAGGNLFFCLFCGGGFFWWGIFGSTRSSSEQLGALGFFWWGILGALGALGAARSTRIFFEGICGGGILFLGGGGVCFGL